MSEENINIATKEYADAHFGNTSETNGDLVIATKEYVDSIPPGMVMDGTALKGRLCNHYLATTVGDGADGSTLTDGTYMFFACSSLTSWTVELPNLTNGDHMFQGCTALTSWTADLPNLENGTYMFYNCSNLTSWTVGLPNLTNGTYMFYQCSSLTSWATDLPNLTSGDHMFQGCTALTSWTAGILNLENGNSMFYDCSNLTSFSGNLSKLAGASATNGGYYMFYNCSKLKTFNSTLPSLAYGQRMFYGCILDEASILRILNSIPTYTSGSHPLHLGKNTNYLNSTEIAALLGTTTPIAAGTYSYKGWTITVQA